MRKKTIVLYILSLFAYPMAFLKTDQNLAKLQSSLEQLNALVSGSPREKKEMDEWKSDMLKLYIEYLKLRFMDY